MLDTATVEVLNDFEHHILEGESVVRLRLVEGGVTSYTDEVLRRDADSHRGFLQSLLSCDFLGATDAGEAQ